MKRQIFRAILILQLCVIGFVLNPSVVFASAALHADFDQILQENVEDGEVNYAGIKSDTKFNQYLKTLEPTQEFENDDEELAYWINTYNALAIKGILDGNSPKTFFGRQKFFKRVKYNVGGMRINLYDLEHKIIIPFGDPRIHFAINCASGSCPKLLAESYKPENLEQQLDQVAKSFLNDKSRNHFDHEKKTAYLSKIFDWFEKDFVKHSGSVQKYIAQYVEDPEVSKALANEEYKVKYLKYDWSLNGTKPE